MPHAKCNFLGSPCGPCPMPKQLPFDECLMQNATFRARQMILSIFEITKNLAEHSCSAFFECPHGPQWSHFGRRAGRTRSNMSGFEHHSQSKTWFESCCNLVRMALGLHLVPPCARTLFSTLCSGPCATLPCAKRGGAEPRTGTRSELKQAAMCKTRFRT